MAIKKVGHDMWESSLLGEVFTSQKAAEHYENLEKQRNVKRSAGDKLLDAMSTEELKSVLISAGARIDDQQNRAQRDAQAGEWVSAHPELFTSSQENALINSGALRGWLLQQGKREPFSHWDFENAYSALATIGALRIDESKLPKVKEVTNDEDNYVSPLDAFRFDNSRFRPA